MCGIAGYYLKTPEADRRRLEEMARRLAHRGPDGQGFHTAGRVGLAHTRLSIIDLAGGAQPLYSEDHRLCLVANGEIYNSLELRRELEDLGHSFATHSDCETILHAYEAWGEAALDRLQGMFAFALHDTEREELLLVRDRLGIKPLYFTIGAEGLGFASELKALLPLIGRPEVDPAGLAQYLQHNFTCAPHTLLAGVSKLRPGELAKMGPDGVLHQRRYWSPLQTAQLDLTLDEALERFDALIDQVITIHLRSDVPFGLFLSGGVDSSLLAALISRQIGEPLRTFSVGFPDTSVHNELAAAARVAAQFGTRHTAIEARADELLERLPHVVWAADDLTADYANLPVSLRAERAGAELKVVFSGEGGDEVFAGYGRYRVPLLKRLLARLRHPGGGDFRGRGLFSAEAARLFRPELAEAMQHWRAPFAQAWNETPATWTRLMRMQYVDLETWLPDDLLIKADRMLMAWGVEGRVPFLDHRLVEFGLGLPDALKVEGRNGKRFLKLWGERFFPKAHLWGRKKGFTVPVRDWFQGERLERLDQVLTASPGMAAWFDPAAVRQMIERQRSDRSGPLWALLNFALWHRIMVEDDGAAPPTRQDPFSYFR
ncbi:asparagine synthase (glutamine-hydrolyzing) [Candidatus Contendibacter odensensis]|uniref:asparagine synthase (glutamine-hydrolyzing) n=1 Tax=Candidatus Contendobacter odensis Run_B_J11 TaxID=1400861 RepID=A0A7U7J2G0_9GAMM|nr:asparagine synthase (glutamine-hydrolyzing) [Candidatus Contendobacter odensis]CDH44095.1 Asparagine synthetase, glutamine-hydrolyzing [Candidatus Contendobacter odensis Run_B_J11]